MKKIFSLVMIALLVLSCVDLMAQAKPKGGKKDASPFIEGRQKVRQSDYDTIWQFTNFNTKDLNIYYCPFDYGNMMGLVKVSNPNWGSLRPAINYLEKVSRATMTMCAIYAVNPEIDNPAQREKLSKQGRDEAKECLDAFEEWKVKKEMRNKVQYKVAEVDYRYFKGAYYYDEHVSEPVVHVGLLLYFGTKKKPMFAPDTVSRIFDDIRFFPNDATIVESWLSHIDTVAAYLKDNERKGVLLTGYSDNNGTEAYCMGLSRQRAMEVKKALLLRGIEENRIELEAKGDADPIGDNETREGRILNNRVSIKIQ